MDQTSFFRGNLAYLRNVSEHKNEASRNNIGSYHASNQLTNTPHLKDKYNTLAGGKLLSFLAYFAMSCSGW
jgi:hypothetical protein